MTGRVVEWVGEGSTYIAPKAPLFRVGVRWGSGSDGERVWGGGTAGGGERDLKLGAGRPR
jgi:hypothetical protein